MHIWDFFWMIIKTDNKHFYVYWINASIYTTIYYDSYNLLKKSHCGAPDNKHIKHLYATVFILTVKQSFYFCILILSAEKYFNNIIVNFLNFVSNFWQTEIYHVFAYHLI